MSFGITWIRTVSADSVFIGLDVDKLLGVFDQIIKNPHHHAKDMIPAVYRALVRFDVVTEAEAAVGVAQILKLRTKLLNKERLAKKREAA